MDERIPHGGAVWASETWRREALEWIDARLAETGAYRTGAPGAGRVRPWSAVMAVPTSAGGAWFKATAPATSFEVGLYGVLRATAPEATLAPIGADAARGWLLLPEGGPTLAERGGSDRLAEVLPVYARLQRRSESAINELLGAGLADMRPARLADRFAEARDALRAGDDDRRPGDLLERLDVAAPWVAEQAERLDRSAVPAGLDHNDVHPGNVLGDAEHGFRLYDWGDAVVAHPFASMLVPLGLLRSRGERTGAGQLAARDAYLAEFSDLAPHAELAADLERACRLATIARALTWERALRSARKQGEPIDPSFAGGVRESLASILDDAHVVDGRG